MNNTNKSELVVAKILSKMSENGLQDSTLGFSDHKLDKAVGSFLDTCIKWLADDNIIRFSELIPDCDDGPWAVSNPVLTSYGYSLLNRPLLDGQKGKTVGTAVKSASEKGTSYAGIGDFIGGLLGGFTKSIESG
jgi:hypothetical protein